MKRRLWLSTVALASVLGTVTASAQARRPSEHEQNLNPSQAAPAQPPGQTRNRPQAGAAAQNPHAVQPNEQTENAAARAPSATTAQAAPSTQPQQNAPAANTNNQAQQPATGQAQTQPQSGTARSGQVQTQPPRGAAQTGEAQQGQTEPTSAANAAGGNANAAQNANANGQAGEHGVITLNEQQNTRVATAIRQANVKPLADVSFSIAVGTEIPASVELHVPPPALVEIVPQYRGYNFVVVEQEALIIDPSTRAIVAVVPFEEPQTTGANAPPPAQAAAPPREHKKIEATRDLRETPRRQARRHHKADTEKHVTIEERRTTIGAGPREPRVGDRMPDGAIIEGRPVEVYRDGPAVRDYRPHRGVRDIPLIGPLLDPRDEY